MNRINNARNEVFSSSQSLSVYTPTTAGNHWGGQLKTHFSIYQHDSPNVTLYTRLLNDFTKLSIYLVLNELRQKTFFFKMLMLS